MRGHIQTATEESLPGETLQSLYLARGVGCAIGYGHESTHEGFLQYLINTSGPEVGTKIVRCLCDAAGASDLVPGQTTVMQSFTGTGSADVWRR